MPATINTRPQAIDLSYYPGQTITLSLIFPDTYLDSRVFKAFLGGRTSPGVELTCTEEPDTVTLTIVADSSDTQAFDWPAEFTLVPFTAPSTYGAPIFVGTWTPGTDGQVTPTVASFTVRTPDEIQVTVIQSSPPGEIGPEGPEGPPGSSVTIIGTLPDVGDLPMVGNTVGDGYLIDGDLWVWTVDLEWVNVGTIQGPPGANGTNGTNGTNGANGNTVLYGTAAPTTEGVNGDFYIRTTTNFIYGPKTAGAWPSGTSLVGPTGAAGANGTDGADGVVQSIVAGDGVTVDDTDPANPIVSSDGSGEGGGLLAVTAYDPSSMATYTTTTTLADMDATNLLVTFTAPDSGNVLIRLTCIAYPNGAGTLYWGLRSGSTTVIEAKVAADEATNVLDTRIKAFVVTGLTPGNSYTYKWAARHASSSWTNRWGGSGTADLQGAALMEVVTAPF